LSEKEQKEPSSLVKNFSIYDYEDESDVPSEDNPIYISFYPAGYCLEETILYQDQSENVNIVSIFDEKIYQCKTEIIDTIFKSEAQYSIN
jgi:hypothetical protein